MVVSVVRKIIIIIIIAFDLILNYSSKCLTIKKCKLFDIFRVPLFVCRPIKLIAQCRIRLNRFIDAANKHKIQITHPVTIPYPTPQLHSHLIIKLRRTGTA